MMTRAWARRAPVVWTALLITMMLCMLQCKTANAPVDSTVQGTASVQSLKLCAAVRGNGPRIFAHFSSLARLSEHYGVFDAMAGGSSGSMTAFLYESMRLNPEVSRCGSRSCDEAELSLRIALLLKSIYGYVEYLSETPEANAILGLTELWPLVRDRGVEGLIASGKLTEATAEVEAVMRLPRFGSLINKSVFDRLAAGKVIEIVEQVRTFGNFKVADQTPFFREGLVDFKEFARAIGRLGDFYAGRQLGGLGAYLDQCAGDPRFKYKLWKEIEAIDGGLCNAQFKQLATDYHETTKDKNIPNPRIADPMSIGPVKIIVSTSLLEGAEAMGRYEAAKSRFEQGAAPDFDVVFESMVKVGYFGAPADVNRVAANPLGFADDRSVDIVAVLEPQAGLSYQWEVPLTVSPAEPGLANIQVLTATRASVGGWADLHPVQALKNLGCETVAFVSRVERGDDFAVQVAGQLNATPGEMDRLFNLRNTNPLSANRLALDLADGIWCTDWNSFEVPEKYDELWAAGYEPPLISMNSRFLAGRPGFEVYPGIVREKTPGACLP